jgi:hypothetical protein
MKKSIIILSVALLLQFSLAAQDSPSIKEWKVVTVVESIVPMGLGRSRIIENMTEVNTEDFRTSRVNGKSSAQGSVKRKDLKVDNFDETKILNFFSATGINFQNIASNDAMIGARIMELSGDGYTLVFVTSGVESNAGTDDGEGLFITRMFFSK